jgi:hypothetical protein
MGEDYSTGSVPQLTSTERQLLVKLLIAANNNTGGGGGGGSGLYGSGSPAGAVSASPGTTYIDTSTGNFWVKQTGTGSSGWLELISS